MRPQDKLEKIDDNTFKVAGSSQDGSRSLEWRRGFEWLDLSLSNIGVYSNFLVNEIDDLKRTLKNIGKKPSEKDDSFYKGHL